MKKNKQTKIKQYTVIRIPMGSKISTEIVMAESPNTAAKISFKNHYSQLLKDELLSIINIIELSRNNYWNFDFIFTVDKVFAGDPIPISETFQVSS